MRFVERFFLLSCLGLVLLVPARAEAQRTIRCESQGDARHLCPINNLNESSVRVSKRLSDSPCIQGRSWGTVANNIWVAQGCRAEFSYVGGNSAVIGGNQNNNNYGGSGVRTITCESQGDARHACNIPNLNEGSVKLVKRVSQSACIKGTSWGSAANVIWVSRGCRAEFSYRQN